MADPVARLRTRDRVVRMDVHELVKSEAEQRDGLRGAQ
jgi:hypothetical protein